MRRCRARAASVVPTVTRAGSNLRCRGRHSRHVASAATWMAAAAPMPHRQSPRWVTSVGRSLPTSPPNPVPATYMPAATATWPASNSSAMYATTVAGTPASSAPCRNRMARSTANDGANTAATDRAVAPMTDATMTGRRPTLSLTADTGMMNSAMPSVSAETVQPVQSAPTPKPRPSAGRIPCVQYSAVNVTTPAATAPTIVVR